MNTKTDNRAEQQAASQYEGILSMLAAFEAAAGDCADEEEARQRIQEDPFSVEVRSDWTTPGEPLEPSEFTILLCTGGPAVRIVGELNLGEPCRAWLEYQDWGTPWNAVLWRRFGYAVPVRKPVLF